MKRIILGTCAILACALMLMSCSGGEGSGSVAQNPSVVVSTSAFGPNQTCPNGGINVQSGIDDNGNGVLDPAEVDVVQEVCNGADGLNSLIKVTPEPAGANCADGGQKIEAGVDSNGNAILDTTEIASTEYICNGAGGADGADGLSALIKVTPEPAGANCADGGQRIDTGLDTNSNAILDIAEITATEYVCDGAGGTDGTDGLNALIKVTAEPAGANCADGGQKIEAGVDSNGNSVLDALEVTSTEYVCNGAGGITVPIITGVSPEEAKQGQEIRITGVGFGTVQGTSTLTIGGVEALSTDIVSWGEYEIRSTVPSGASTGIVSAIVTGVQSNPGFFVLLWTNENPVNTAICTAINYQYFPQIVPDGSGGAIIAWQDLRSGTYKIYAQRVDASGNVLWTADGVAVSTAANGQFNPQLAPDGSGGAIIVWKDLRSGIKSDIYAQRVDASGNALWTAAGIAVSTAANDQWYPQIVPDGTGGAIIAWQDLRNNTNFDIYAQRVDASGNALWTANGVAVSTAVYDQFNPQLAPDGLGGAIIAWEDYRSGTYYDIYARRVDASGNVLWTTNGVAVSTAANDQFSPAIVSDSSGGAIIAWEDYRSGTDYDIYAQRVDASGNALWTADGVAASTAVYDQFNLQIVPDSFGGAIIVWEDHRSGTYYDIYARRVDASGNALWTADGVAVSTAVNDQFNPQLAPDSMGGAIIAWQDLRSGTGYYDIYAQRVDTWGYVHWAADGIAVSTAANHQYSQQIVPDGSGGAIIEWQDYRSGTGIPDIYAQGISASGRQ